MQRYDYSYVYDAGLDDLWVKAEDAEAVEAERDAALRMVGEARGVADDAVAGLRYIQSMGKQGFTYHEIATGVGWDRVYSGHAALAKSPAQGDARPVSADCNDAGGTFNSGAKTETPNEAEDVLRQVQGLLAFYGPLPHSHNKRAQSALTAIHTYFQSREGSHD